MTAPDLSWRDLAHLHVQGGTPLEGTAIEIIRPCSAAASRCVLFDFDGTLSLIRSGWVEVMVPFMVELLADLKTGESRDRLEELVREFVARLTGKQTIYQMQELARQIRARGGTPLDPKRYKRMYLGRLRHLIKDRIAALRRGTASPDSFLVPGSRALLEELKRRGLTVYIASGTDQADVRYEAELLRITHYAQGGIYGALNDPTRFSKRMVIQRIIREHAVRAGELLAFGDGFVEIEDVKEAGGCAVGVATHEPACDRIDQWKRKRLILAGADCIIPNYLEWEKLLAYLCEGEGTTASEEGEACR